MLLESSMAKKPIASDECFIFAAVNLQPVIAAQENQKQQQMSLERSYSLLSARKPIRSPNLLGGSNTPPVELLHVLVRILTVINYLKDDKNATLFY